MCASRIISILSSSVNTEHTIHKYCSASSCADGVGGNGINGFPEIFAICVFYVKYFCYKIETNIAVCYFLHSNWRQFLRWIALSPAFPSISSPRAWNWDLNNFPFWAFAGMDAVLRWFLRKNDCSKSTSVPGSGRLKENTIATYCVSNHTFRRWHNICVSCSLASEIISRQGAQVFLRVVLIWAEGGCCCCIGTPDVSSIFQREFTTSRAIPKHQT